MAEIERRSVFWTFWWTIAGFLIFGVLTAFVLKAIPVVDPEAKRAEARMKNLQELRKSDAEILSSDKYAWADKSKGIMRLPISRAIELTISELKSKTPRPAGPIPTPTPAAGAAPSQTSAPSPA